MNSKIILKNLTKSFVKNKKIKVLNNINFTFRAGKIYSIMGPSLIDHLSINSLDGTSSKIAK